MDTEKTSCEQADGGRAANGGVAAGRGAASSAEPAAPAAGSRGGLFLAWDAALPFAACTALSAWTIALLLATGPLDSAARLVAPVPGIAQLLFLAGLVAALALGTRRPLPTPGAWAKRHPTAHALLGSAPAAAIAASVVVAYGDASARALCSVVEAVALPLAGATTAGALRWLRTAARDAPAAQAAATVGIGALAAMAFLLLREEAAVVASCVALPCALACRAAHEAIGSRAARTAAPAGPEAAETQRADAAAGQSEPRIRSLTPKVAFARGLYGVATGYLLAIGNSVHEGPWGAALAYAAIIIPCIAAAAAGTRGGFPRSAAAARIVAAATAVTFLPFLFAGGDEGLPLLIEASHTLLIAEATCFLLICRERDRCAGEAAPDAVATAVAVPAGILVGWAAGMTALATAGLGSIALHATTAVVIAALALCAAAIDADERPEPAAARADSPDGGGDDRGARTLVASYDAAAARAGLSKREAEVLALLVQGASNKEIAEQLVVSINTVKTHARNIYAKFDVHAKSDLAHAVEAYAQGSSADAAPLERPNHSIAPR